jgi:FtsZ-binding cell division protein ZapB
MDEITQKRLMRLRVDTRALHAMSIEEVKENYDLLERVRDHISEVLDKADGKHVQHR